MAEIPYLVKDLALILMVAGIVTLIFKRLKQPLVLGYIVAGFLVSPHMPYTMSVMDETDIQTWADIGVIFTLFSLGLDFSFKKIVKMGASPIIACIVIVFSMMMLGISVGHGFGWGRMDCIFLGGMLAMSSTTIIYKAFDDMGLRQQKFASMVMSVLILEDILAIVMMVMLSAIAGGNNPDGEQMFTSVLRIGFFLVLWFIVGIFAIPLFLRSVRKFINGETLLIVSLGLCCGMAVLSTKVGFSSAFGAFVMGSILAETIEAEKIIKLVEPVKNLFGAIFFVSVGMLVDPKILVEYAVPILALVAAILIGQAILGTFGFMLGGESLKSAMRCGFSMAQIGEFSFIIASLGLSLGVISNFLYPVVVAVSVITTFLTPYMIRLAQPSYQLMEKHLPNKFINILNHFAMSRPSTQQQSKWKSLIRQMVINTVAYSILSAAAIAMMFTFVLPSDAQSAARLEPPLVRQRHHGSAHHRTHIAFPASHRDEEESQPGMEATVGGEQHQPHSAALHDIREIRHCPGLHLLYHQLSVPIHQCADGMHRSRDCTADVGFTPHQETKHRDGASLPAQPAFARYCRTGERRKAPALRGTSAGQRYPYQ